MRALSVLVLGTVFGLGATWAAVWQGLGFGAVKAGPWTAWPRAGQREADPYARAALSRTGELPLDLTEGLTFFARMDSSGADLSARCVYRVSGATPPARYWTLTATDGDGALLPNPAKRYGFTSSEILRDETGAFAIRLSPTARAGDWLPMPQTRNPMLVLRLYDTPAAAAASALDASALPSIVKEACP